MPDEFTTELAKTDAKKPVKAPVAKPIQLPPFRPMQSTGAPAYVDAQASATGTSAIVVAALKAAHKWTPKTKITRAEFIQKRDAWLARPASEV